MKDMKKVMFSLICLLLVASAGYAQQDKSKRASPPDSVIIQTNSGLDLRIDYSKPSLKGRQLGVDLAPIGKVWRTGANETTVFEIKQDALVEGKPLAAGKYGLFSIPGEKETIIIFSKVWDKWGTQYDEKQDALRITVPNVTQAASTEQFTIQAQADGKVRLLWGNVAVPFTVVAAP